MIEAVIYTEINHFFNMLSENILILMRAFIRLQIKQQASTGQ